ncbi:hypothetical protein jhhlp_008786 [Lomentospora prolificans]|uniref:Cation-transporting P-type ATPase N-terminal domain-containing protein n=1 Tax=Lomentospora prolificans TaxID=41688 RepID=A0A2N3MZ09_9PEZI|nr:hypothetical protein jhhlp_008786 [Lomentospora prolificans]
MSDEHPAKLDDPEAPSALRITFGGTDHSAGRSERGGRPTDPHGGRHQRSLSRDSRSSAGSRGQPQSPYAGVQIEYRTLSIHVSESRHIDQGADAKLDVGKNREEYFSGLTYHELQVDQVCQLFNVSLDQGLTENAASIRLARDGKNTLPKVKTNYIKQTLKYLFGGFCSVLWVGAVIFFICWKPLSNPPSVQNLSLAVLILIVIFLQAGFSAFQDWSAARTMDSILDLLPSETIVKRDCETKPLSACDLVCGDIVFLRAGDKVPADIRILSHSGDIKFDRSVLTGESEEVEGTVDPTDTNFLQSRNIALMGTTVLNGNGVGVVVLTGGRSVIGRVANASVNVKKEAVLIQREIWRFVRIIVCMTIFLALLILLTWVGWLRVSHPGFLTVPAMLVNVMACVVAFIPEGMPVGVALTLMRVAHRMKAVNILPKSLSTVETLGCVNVICSDKTGTLTQGSMFVKTVAFVDRTFCLTGETPHSFDPEDSDPAMAALQRASILCNDASFDPSSLHLPVNQRGIQGNPTDGAVLRFVSSQFPQKTVAAREPRALEIPFNSTNKWMLTLFELPELEPGQTAKSYRAIIKGAPDVLLHGCTHYWSTDARAVVTLNPDVREKVRQIQDKLSRNAERVLVFCEKIFRPRSVRGTNAFRDEVEATALTNLTIIGMLGIVDPPRDESADTVRQCREAGARFFMVTGDYALTAAAIARQIGIFASEEEADTIENVRSESSEMENNDRNDGRQLVSERKTVHRFGRGLIMEGSSMADLSDEDWDVICAYEEVVFARTTPEQKLRIVTELRARHNVVAVTGDGVNDAPALRAADVGVAVVTGSDVAIDAADLVLLDKFDSIVDAIRLGRLVFQNLQKVIAYLLPAGSWSEIWPVLVNVFFGVPLPLSAFLMIIICVFTDLFLSLSLIMEKEEFNLMSQPPRNHQRDHLINLKIYAQAYLFVGSMETITAHSMFFLYMYKYAGMPISELFFLFENYKEGYRGYTQAELNHFNATGQCVYFVTLVFLQLGNVLAMRNRRVSIVEADPIRKKRRNPWLILSMLTSVAIAVFVTEVPGIQKLFDTASVPVEFWLIPIPLGIGILCMDELRKLIVRLFPKSFVARVAW